MWFSNKIALAVFVALLLCMMAGTLWFSLEPPEKPCTGSDCCIWQITCDFSKEHIGGYAAIAFLLSGCLSYCWFNRRMYRLPASFLGCQLFGLLIEMLQPGYGRYFDVNDLIANGLGVIVGMVVWECIAGIINVFRNTATSNEA